LVTNLRYADDMALMANTEKRQQQPRLRNM